MTTRSYAVLAYVNQSRYCYDQVLGNWYILVTLITLCHLHWDPCWYQSRWYRTFLLQYDCRPSLTQIYHQLLTHWGRDAIWQITFSNEFSWMTMNEFRLGFHRINIPALIQIYAWHRPGDKTLSVPILVRLPTRICVTWSQLFKIWISYYSHGFMRDTVINTLRPWQYCLHFIDDIFKCISWMKMYEFWFRFHFSWLLGSNITIFQN